MEDLFETIGRAVKGQNDLVIAGVPPEQATRIAFTENKYKLIEVEARLFDALIKYAFLKGQNHEILRTKPQEEAIADCIREINSMI